AGCAPAPRSAAVRSAAVKDLLAKVLHLEHGFVGPSLDRPGKGGVDHLGDEDVMIALLDDLDHRKIERRGGAVEDRGAAATVMDGFARELSVLGGDRLEEGEGGSALALAQQAQRALAG